MQTGLSIALLNPAIAAVLAAAFLVLWTYQRASFHLLMLAFGYAASGVGFLLQYFSLPFTTFATEKLASCVAFTLAVVCITTAIQSRYVRRIPYGAVAALALGGIAAFSWFLFVEPDLTWRIYAANFAFGGLCLLCAAELRPVRREGPIQRVLFWLTLVAASNFLVRTLVAVALHGPFVSYDGFYTSAYWTTTQLVHATLSLMTALCLLTATVTDMMGRLKAQSDTDPLSGLLNRRGFEERAAALLERSAHNNLPVALVLADLDHFKAVNDRHGHAAGDRVIVDFATKIRLVAGARGVAGRIGGEEFAVILPLADLGAARLFAETVRTLFSTGNTDGLSPGTRMTASFGVAARSGQEPLAPLMERADEALYKAKQNGRDSVRISYLRPEMPFRGSTNGNE
ncbi:GGDEF domain-containing protein [Aquamicrobium soli]|uniref:diguanylate cyclase n=1 Tax=Aquamicrobium soli TaxID=1811518 RepID=A0ABV7K9X0_9HYPH